MCFTIGKELMKMDRKFSKIEILVYATYQKQTNRQ